MTKLKTPLLSMDAHGTVGNAITFQSSTKRKYAREKPELPYSRTLPQQYQRWLYEDYCYLWRQQSEATRQEYASAGVRHHLTGFQYWMKIKLVSLDDIVALWHCEPPHTDYSRNGYDLTLAGVSAGPGLIGPAYYFDGLNDQAYALNPPLLDFTSEDFTIEFFVRPEELTTTKGIYWRGWQNARGIAIIIVRLAATNFRLSFETYQAGARQRTRSSQLYPWALDTWLHVALTRSGPDAVFFINGSSSGNLPAVHIDPVSCTDHARLGIWHANYLKGWMDHFIIRNRVLDQAEITRHSERRYQL